MVFVNKEDAIFHRVKQGFKDATLCDVNIVALDKREIPCSSYMLSCTSTVLGGLIAEKKSAGKESAERVISIRLDDAEPSALEDVLSYAHCGRIKIVDENVLPLAAIAQKFQFHELIEACGEYLDEHLDINKNSCFPLLREALRFGVSEVSKRCEKFIVNNMSTLPKDQACLSLGYASLWRIFTRIPLYIDYRSDTVSKKHIGLVETVLKWLEMNRNAPQERIIGLLDNVDITLVSTEAIAKVLSVGLARNTPELAGKALNAMGVIGRHLPCPCLRIFERKIGRWQSWEAPFSGAYFILARGAKGGDYGKWTGGKGAIVGGAVVLQGGETVRILIGNGGVGSKHDGGGGCCVVIDSLGMVLVAGGGGGASTSANGSDARPDDRGGDGQLGGGKGGRDGSQGCNSDGYGGSGCGVPLSENPLAPAKDGRSSWCDGGKGRKGCGGGGGGYSSGGGGGSNGHGTNGGGGGGGSFLHEGCMNSCHDVGNEGTAYAAIWPRCSHLGWGEGSCEGKSQDGSFFSC
ncbi:hypothetical protein BSKO_10511 [Bryopsis sp. KO-2023]|nr:hypothetical protein BSKO_10511 [Bryopsis sp. KO-2023]